MDVEFIDGLCHAIFADFVYENNDFSWADHSWNALQEGGVLIAMTDYHTVFELGVHLKTLPNAHFLNHLVWKNEWGNHPKDRFHQCFDDILIFTKGKEHKFYSDRIQVPKATVNTKLNKSGRLTKTATAFINDICLTTTSNERIKQDDGHLIKWQKPLDLMSRLFLPFTNEDDVILDLFMGSGTLGEWCLRNKRFYVGVENNYNTYQLATKRLREVYKELEDGKAN